MGLRREEHPLLEGHPSLQKVMSWWADKRHAGSDLGALRGEVRSIRRSRKRLSAVGKSAGFLVGQTSSGAGEPDLGKLPGTLHPLIWNFALADEMALRYQAIQRWDCRRLLGLVALCGAGFWLLKYGPQIWPAKLFNVLPQGVAAGIALIVIAGAVSAIQRNRFRRNRGRYLVSRTLAEALRVDLAQRMAGTKLDTVAEFARQHEVADDASFSKHVLKSALECAEPPAFAGQANGLGLARTLWLEDQLRFFGDPSKPGGRAGETTGSTERERRSHRRAERRMKTGAAILFFFLAISLISWGLRLFIGGEGSAAPELGWVMGLGAASELLAGICGIWVGYYHQMGALHAVTAQKYHRARLYLEDALRDLDGAQSDEKRREILACAGRLALAETADWGVHQREHAPRTAFR